GLALGPILAGLALLAVFCVIETRFAKDPLVPFKELTKPLQVANGIVLLFSAALFPMWFLSSLYLQQVLGLSPLHTGLTFLPMALMIMVCASRAGKLVSVFGVRSVLGGGLGLALLITLATQHTTHLIGAGRGVPQALTEGFKLAYWIGAGFTAAAAVATFLLMPKPAKAAAAAVRRAQVAIGVAVVVAGF